jgi:hypothetical protein
MPTEPSAENRFVEAMRGLLWSGYQDKMRAAVEAFADAVCKQRACSDEDHWGTYGVCDADEEHTRQEHAACRARLLARVMGEADGR